MTEKVKDINQEDMMFYKPDELDIVQPSGKKLTIREMNGEDEDLLSNIGSNQSGEAFYKFISNIITSERISYEEVRKWGGRDINYILFKARIHSMGPELIFDHTFSNREGTKMSFEEDLSKFDCDLSDPESKPKDELIGIKPYPVGYEKGYFQGQTSSGLFYRMDYLTGVHQDSLLGVDEATLSINDKLRVRNFRIAKSSEGPYQQIENFKNFSKKMMAEFRKSLRENDEGFDLIIDVVGPKGLREEVSLFLVRNFFFPEA